MCNAHFAKGLWSWLEMEVDSCRQHLHRSRAFSFPQEAVSSNFKPPLHELADLGATHFSRTCITPIPVFIIPWDFQLMLERLPCSENQFPLLLMAFAIIKQKRCLAYFSELAYSTTKHGLLTHKGKALLSLDS
jgi:hypothetical protein